jgi:hypothetical protein
MSTFLSLCLLACICCALSAVEASCGEDVTKICYGDPSGQSQNLNVDDIAYAAAQVRYVGEANTGSAALWTSK